MYPGCNDALFGRRADTVVGIVQMYVNFVDGRYVLRCL